MSNPYDSPQSSGYASPQPKQQEGQGKAVASLVLGLIGIIMWCLPILGFPINVTGLILGAISLKTPSRGLAMAGVILCTIGLLLSIVNAIVGVWIYMRGEPIFP